MAINAPTGVYVLDLGLPWEDQTPQPVTSQTTWGRFDVTDWSPNGELFAGMYDVADTGVGTYALDTGQHVRLTDFGQWPVWLPDNRRLVFVSGGNAFYVVDRQTLEVRQVYSAVNDVLGPPRLTPDGSMIVFSRRVTEADIWMVTIE
jgi:Tol biopolymer transport system component